MAIELKSTRFIISAEPSFIEKVDDWRRSEDVIPSRAEAIRRLTSIGIEAIPIIAEMICYLERQTDDPEALAMAARLRDILARK